MATLGSFAIIFACICGLVVMLRMCKVFMTLINSSFDKIERNIERRLK